MARFNNNRLNSNINNFNDKAMKRIKRFRDNRIKIESKTQDGKTMWLPYKPYLLNNIPKNFGCIEFNNEQEGIPSWFNYKGLTYVLDV